MDKGDKKEDGKSAFPSSILPIFTAVFVNSGSKSVFGDALPWFAQGGGGKAVDEDRIGVDVVRGAEGGIGRRRASEALPLERLGKDAPPEGTVFRSTGAAEKDATREAAIRAAIPADKGGGKVGIRIGSRKSKVGAVKGVERVGPVSRVGGVDMPAQLRAVMRDLGSAKSPFAWGEGEAENEAMGREGGGDAGGVEAAALGRVLGTSVGPVPWSAAAGRMAEIDDPHRSIALSPSAPHPSHHPTSASSSSSSAHHGPFFGFSSVTPRVRHAPPTAGVKLRLLSSAAVVALAEAASTTAAGTDASMSSFGYMSDVGLVGGAAGVAARADLKMGTASAAAALWQPLGQGDEATRKARSLLFRNSLSALASTTSPSSISSASSSAVEPKAATTTHDPDDDKKAPSGLLSSISSNALLCSLPPPPAIMIDATSSTHPKPSSSSNSSSSSSCSILVPVEECDAMLERIARGAAALGLAVPPPGIATPLNPQKAQELYGSSSALQEALTSVERAAPAGVKCVKLRLSGVREEVGGDESSPPSPLPVTPLTPSPALPTPTSAPPSPATQPSSTWTSDVTRTLLNWPRELVWSGDGSSAVGAIGALAATLDVLQRRGGMVRKSLTSLERALLEAYCATHGIDTHSPRDVLAHANAKTKGHWVGAPPMAWAPSSGDQTEEPLQVSITLWAPDEEHRIVHIAVAEDTPKEIPNLLKQAATNPSTLSPSLQALAAQFVKSIEE